VNRLAIAGLTGALNLTGETMLNPRSLLAVTVIAATTIAQTAVLPTSAAAVGGSTANVFPWGTSSTAYPGMRIMCLYDSSHFTGATPPVTGPVMITTLKWRANDAAATTSWTGGTYPNATVRLATAAVDYSAATTTWATNVGPDVTTVYTGPVTVNAGVGAGVGVPGPYHVVITLTTPFIYDPTAGDLVVDTEHIPSTFVGGSLTSLDVHIPSVNASRVYSSTFYPTANGVDNNCDVMEIGYSAVTGTPAQNLIVGQGCVQSAASFFELFAAASGFDLDNTVLTMLPTPGGYVVLNSVGAMLPVGSIATPVSLVLSDDSEVTQTFTVGTFPGATAFNICSNGYVSIGSNGTSYTPDINGFLNATNTAWRTWHDFNPSTPGSGQVKYEESAAAIVVTWDGVWDYGGTTAASANTFQMQFFPSGQVTLAWGTMSHLGNAYLVGYSPGGNSNNPGGTDLSLLGANVITLGSTDILPLALAPSTRPVLGTNWNLTTSQIPATGVFGMDIFGVADPGVLDLFFLGMPGCQLRTTLDVIVGPWLVGGTTHNYSFAVPPAPPSLVGFQLFTQSAVFQVPPVNAFGAIISNGVRGTLGDV
jgi:hypothetical protein